MADFKRRFGVDYLKQGSSHSTEESSNESTRGATRARAAMDEALTLYTQPVLKALKESQGFSAHVFDLAKRMSVRVDVLSPVTDYLVEKRWVERMEDPSGDDKLVLTDDGKRVVPG